MIRTGVDAKGEFSPEHTAPRGGLSRGCFHVLYPGRLVDQKDPMLMVEVARRLREAGSGFCIHVVGEGELEAPVREAVGRHGLGEVVKLHPATSDLGPWYAACDALLMTSRFEGVPYVAYEAMAMGMPVVAPALPGNVELIEDDLGVLVDPRDDAAGYARALGGLVNDPARSARMGRRARENMLERHSLRQMASLHESLYEDVLGPRVAVPARGEGPVRSGALRRRPVAGQPLVSVVIPCFDHGRYLRGCLASVRQQKKCRTEILVVDDGSSDPETLQVLDELEEAADVRLLRLEANRGPSAARNHGIEGAGGRYVLFVDADNLLMEDAVWRLVDQIASSGERVGYIYPNLQFFGNRDDYFEAPSFNLATLMHVNYCDTGSLFDSEIFERGHRFDESIVLGHEDWDFVLTLAEHGIIGEPAQHPTLLYRKHGFTRSDRPPRPGCARRVAPGSPPAPVRALALRVPCGGLGGGMESRGDGYLP